MKTKIINGVDRKNFNGVTYRPLIHYGGPDNLPFNKAEKIRAGDVFVDKDGKLEDPAFDPQVIDCAADIKTKLDGTPWLRYWRPLSSKKKKAPKKNWHEKPLPKDVFGKRFKGNNKACAKGGGKFPKPVKAWAACDNGTVLVDTISLLKKDCLIYGDNGYPIPVMISPLERGKK